MRSLLCAAALGAAQAAPAAASVAPAPVGYVLIGVPLIAQTYNACGPASIAQVLQYFGLPVTLAQVSRATRPTERSYMTAQAILNYAVTQGMEARLYRNGGVRALRRGVEMRLPLILLHNISYRGHIVAHWRVAVGFNDQRQEAYLLDPLLGNLTMSYRDFEAAGQAHGGLFALMYPPVWRNAVLGRFG